MNETASSDWILEFLAYCGLAQTCLLLCLCFLVRGWASKLNRKLHRIEANTRHTAKAVTPEMEAEEADV